MSCTGSMDAGPAPAGYPETGLVLLADGDGALKASAQIGSDLVAVAVGDDGHVAYLADSAPGDVYAVHLPDLKVVWKTHTGGAPFGLLLHQGRLYVTLFDDAAVAELDPSTGRTLVLDPTAPHPAAITVDSTGMVLEAGGSGFGIALVDGTLWTADYRRSLLLPGGEGMTVPLPEPVHPFWLAPGVDGALLVAAEGTQEDSDPGAVLSYDTLTGSFQTLARPRDPDQVVQFGSAIFIAAHGERAVLAVRAGRVSTWARGAAAVALAPDPALGLLAVAVNAHE